VDTSLPTAEKSKLIQKRPKSLCASTCQGVTLRFTVVELIYGCC
jgi:hypothetical protein